MNHQDLGTLIQLVKNSSFKDVIDALAGIAASQGDDASDNFIKDKALECYEVAGMLDEVVGRTKI